MVYYGGDIEGRIPKSTNGQAAPDQVKLAQKDLPRDFVDYHKSIRRLQRICGKIKRFCKENASTSYLLVMFYAALKAQAETIRYLNDDLINRKIAWDKATKLPSPGSVVADIASYLDWKNPAAPREISAGKRVSNPTLAALLNSFTEWAVLSEETISCSCGEGGFLGAFKSRTVSYKIMLQTILKVDEKDRLRIKQLVAIRSGDRKFLEHHFEVKRESRLLDDGVIVLTAECALKIGNAVEVEQVFQESTKYFELEKLQSLVTAAVFDWKRW